jgi:hypothetical protein
MDTDIA